MSGLIIATGRRFGRFAVLLFVVPAFVIFCLWMMLMDTHPLWFIISGFIALPVAMMGVAFLLSTLFAGFRRTRIEGISRQEAPALWTLWEAVAGEHRAARTVIVLDNQLNAGISEERTILGLLGRRIFLQIGLPLLAITDKRAFAAVLAHEDAHLRNHDTNGGLRFAEFANSLVFVFEYASPEETVSGKLLYMALGWLSDSFGKEQVRLSRDAEIKADRVAAQSADAVEIARSILLIGAANLLFKEEVYDPLERELMGAMQAPRPPLDRVLEKSALLSDRSLLNAYAGKAYAQPDDPGSTHPSCAQSLAALGFHEKFDVEPPIKSALSEILDSSLTERKIAEANRDWIVKVDDYLQR
ncbi:M48 family metallopeptidase [Mesorhizobium sp. IMUNJ 23232]|uniref:M48 family metallopeptidase n=1 Tax=Mesorhizobium sp. IMUNJ 23232 TaxID=3376064 RepID=UPI0037A0D156